MVVGATAGVTSDALITLGFSAATGSSLNVRAMSIGGVSYTGGSRSTLTCALSLTPIRLSVC